MFRLDPQVLLHHWRMLIFFRPHLTYPKGIVNQGFTLFLVIRICVILRHEKSEKALN